MISSFIDTWNLFAESYLLGAALAMLLPLIGVIVVLRRQLFVAMAISQSSVLGLSVGLWIQHILRMRGESVDLGGWETVLFFSLLASILCIRVNKRNTDNSELATVMVFISSTTLAYLLLSHSPVGLKEVQERMSSSLISSSMSEFYNCVLIFLGLATFWCWFHRSIVLVCTDQQTARAIGQSVIKWEFLLSVIIGLTIGWAVYLSGWLHTFGCLVLPVFIARPMAKSIQQVLCLAPLIGLICSFVGYFFAHLLDVPLSQMVVAVMCTTYLMIVLIKLFK